MSRQSESNKTKHLLRFIRKFNKSKDPQVKLETAQYIKIATITLDDLITILTLCPVGSLPFQHARDNLLVTIPNRSLEALVKIYENIPLGGENEIRSLMLEVILSKNLDNDEWIKVMGAIKFPGHTLSDLAYQHLMGRPQKNIIIFKLHRLTKEGSAERKILEDCMIIPYLSGMSIDELLDITLHCAHNSKLMKAADKMLHFVSS